MDTRTWPVTSARSSCASETSKRETERPLSLVCVCIRAFSSHVTVELVILSQRRKGHGGVHYNSSVKSHVQPMLGIDVEIFELKSSLYCCQVGVSI